MSVAAELEETSLAPAHQGSADQRAALAEAEGLPTSGKCAARLRQEKIRAH